MADGASKSPNARDNLAADETKQPGTRDQLPNNGDSSNHDDESGAAGMPVSFQLGMENR